MTPGIDPMLLPRRYREQIEAQAVRRLADAPRPGADAPALPRKQPAKARIRQKQGDGLNKTERAFLGYLQRQDTGARIYVQDVTLRLGNGVRYTPDFVVTNEWRVSAYETKGFMRDDAAVKIKVAARAYTWITFYLVTKAKHGSWDIQHVQP
jgi:hypothetical protein